MHEANTTLLDILKNWSITLLLYHLLKIGFLFLLLAKVINAARQDWYIYLYRMDNQLNLLIL